MGQDMRGSGYMVDLMDKGNLCFLIRMSTEGFGGIFIFRPH